MINTGRGESVDLPISKQATTILSEVNRLVNDINITLLAAFKSEGKLYLTKMYEKIFNQISVFFKVEVTREQMDISIYRNRETGLSITSINKCFDNIELSLRLGEFNVFENIKITYEELKSHEKNLFSQLILIFRQLVCYKYLMTNLQPPEFVTLEKEIDNIHFSNISQRYKSLGYLKLINNKQDVNENVSEYCKRTFFGYQCQLDSVLQSQRDTVVSYKNLNTEINEQVKYFTKLVEDFNLALKNHNQANTYIFSHKLLKKRISAVVCQIQSELNVLRKWDSASIRLLEKVPVKIKLLKEELTLIANEENQLLKAYSQNAEAVRLEKNQLASLIATKKRNLLAELESSPSIPDIPEPPEFYLYVKTYPFSAYAELEREIKEFERKRSTILKEKIEIDEACNHINTILDKSKEMASDVVKFFKAQFDLLEQIQEKTEAMVNDFKKFQEYKNWQAIVELISVNVPSIRKQCSELVNGVNKPASDDVQCSEERAIFAFITSKKKAIANSLDRRLASLKKELDSLNQQILSHKQEMQEIKNELNDKLNFMYKNACTERERCSQDIPFKEQVSKKIDNINFEFSGQINEIFTENSLLREKQDALSEMQVLEDELTKKQSNLIFVKTVDQFGNNGGKRNPEGNQLAKTNEPEANKNPSVWTRHKGKIVGAIVGLIAGIFVGAGVGATVGAFLAPATLGLSVPVCAVICSVIGAVAGAITGAVGGSIIGSIIECCLQPNVMGEEDNNHERVQVQQTRPRSLPKNIRQTAEEKVPRRHSLSDMQSQSFDERNSERERSYTPRGRSMI